MLQWLLYQVEYHSLNQLMENLTLIAFKLLFIRINRSWILMFRHLEIWNLCLIRCLKICIILFHQFLSVQLSQGNDFCDWIFSIHLAISEKLKIDKDQFKNWLSIKIIDLIYKELYIISKILMFALDFLHSK